MNKHAILASVLTAALQLTTGCDVSVILEPDEPKPGAPPDAAPAITPDGGADYPLLPPPEAFPDAPVVTTPGDAPAPPAAGVEEGVHIVFPPPVSLTTAAQVAMRGVARLPGGVTAVRVNGVDARLSLPNAEGAVAWRVDVAPARGRNEIVVSSTGGNGDIDGEAARGTIDFAPYMPVRPQALDLDVRHDRLFVSDPGLGGIVAYDLETGAPARVDLAPSADVSVAAHAMAIDAAAGRGLALFYESGCNGGTVDQIRELHSIDLHAGAGALEERVVADRACQTELLYGPLVHDSHVVLDAGRERFFVAHHVCTYDEGNECTADIRERRLGDGDLLAEDLRICELGACTIVDMVADRRAPAGFGLLALVSQGDLEDPTFELRAIDPAARTQTSIATIERNLGGDVLTPLTMALDPAGNRLLVLASGFSGQKHVFEIDLGSGAQSRLGVTTGEVNSERDPAGAFIMDSVYDPRRDRLIYAGTSRGGLQAVDLDTGALTRVLHPTIGEGPTLWCDEECTLSTLDDRRQRFFVLAGSEPGFNPDMHIYEVNLLTGARRLVSEHSNQADLFASPRLLADYPEDRLLVIQYDGSDDGVYTVDVATGERAYVGGEQVAELRISPSGWDPERNRIVHADWRGDFALHAHDMDTFEDTILSSDTVGSGPSLTPIGGPFGSERRQEVALDATGTRAFVSQVAQRSLISVDLATGDRTAHAMPEPSGSSDAPKAVLVDAARNRILVGNLPDSSVAAIDLATGARGDFMNLPANRRRARVSELIPDHRNERALLIDDARNVLMVDLQTGEAVLLLRGSP